MREKIADPRALVGVVIAVAISATAHAGGGYLPTTWGWAIAGPAAVALAALLLRAEIRIPRVAAAFVLLLAAFVAWTAVSLLWTDSVPRTVAEVERDFVYLATIGALVVLPRGRGAIVAGTLVAICGVCVVSLATRLFPDRYGLDPDTAFRLSDPIGYWNGLGLVAAIGALLAVGVVADARSRAVRSAAAAGLVPLLATLFATLSRGGWLALVAGLCVALAAHPARGRFGISVLVAGAPAAVGVVLFARADELTGAPSTLEAATADGHRLALALTLLALLAAGAPYAVDAVLPALSRLRRPPRRVVVAAATVAGAFAVVATVVFAERAYDGFRTPQRFGEKGLRERLFSFSGQNRSEYWRVALDEYRDRPLLGSGAGTYDLAWTENRPLGVGARDAHSLYVETLAELGPVGLLLLAAALGSPFLALRTARRRSLVPALAGAYTAFLVHAAADWDWELPAVALAGLLCGAGLASSGGDDVPVAPRARRALTGVAAALAVAALAIQRGNDAVAQSEAALFAGRPADAIAGAVRAERWAPWTAAAWRVRSDAERALGDREAALRSSRRAVRRDPNDWTGWYLLARLATGGERERAVERVRALNPLAPALDIRGESR